jgi:hypothetical protein
LHALAFGDALGECGLVMLCEGLGFGPGASGSSTGSSTGSSSSGGSSTSSSSGGSAGGSSTLGGSHGDGGGVGSSGGAANGSVRDSVAACAARDVWLQALARAGGPRQAQTVRSPPASAGGSLRESIASGGPGFGGGHSSPLVRPSLYEGVVRKKGGGALVRWQARHFTLDAAATVVRYYDDTTGYLKGSIPMHSVEHVTPGADCHFTVVSRPLDAKKATSKDKATRVWDLQAATRAEMFDWVFALEHGLALRRATLKAQQAISSQTSTVSATIASGGTGRAAQGRGGPMRPGGGRGAGSAGS